MSERINLDELERIAAAAEADEWEWSDGALRGRHNGQVVAYATEGNHRYDAAIVIGVSDKAHIAANSPPVTLALIAIAKATLALRDVSCSCRCCRGLSETRYAGECALFDAEGALSDALDRVTS
jgi:hypothetical protein